VIAEVNGEFTVKRLRSHSQGLYLVPANDMYPVRQVHRRDTFSIWAVVKFVIHSF
jgi:DNA polymerase V